MVRIPGEGPPPAWFIEAVRRRPTHHGITVAGRRIHHLRWDDPTADTAVLLVHGGAAHAEWWGHVAPLLRGRQVAAMDLSGHGDSDWRTDGYSFGVWAEEVMATARDVSGRRPVLLVGHSMGGIVSAMAAALGPVAGIVMVDAPLRESATAPSVQDSEAIFRRVRASPDHERMLSRFRLLPAQPVVHPALLRHVAEHSVRHTSEGWRWKFDPSAFGGVGRGRPDDVAASLRVAPVPVGAIVGERSPIVSPSDRREFQRLAERVSTPGSYLELPEGHHHLMFDQPRELAAAVRHIAAAFLGA